MLMEAGHVQAPPQRSKTVVFGLVQGLLVKTQRGAESHEDLLECSEHDDNGLVLMDGGSDEVTLVMQEHRKQHAVILCQAC